MHFTLETLNLKRHDVSVVADLIARSDKEMNPLVYGKDPAAVIAKLIELGGGYFDPLYTNVVVHGDQILGVVVGFPVCDKPAVDKTAGTSFAKAIGFLSVLRRMPFFMKLDKIMSDDMDESGYYIHTLSVAPSYQGQGLGTAIIQALAGKHPKMYLHVNKNNLGALRFYNKVGFVEKACGTTTHRGRELSESLMERSA